MDVAIVGVGLHPFGRFGDRTGIDMGAVAIRRALADAGVAWRDIQFAFAGSYEIDNPDAVVALLGLTGIPFTNVYNGCATAASVLALAADTIRLGEHDLGLAVGMDKHLPGAFSSDPRLYACPAWYGELGHFLTPKFFGMKINKYMHDHGISATTLARVAAKGYRNGALNPNAFRRKPLSEDESGRLIANLMGIQASEEYSRSRIAEAAEGNPLFVEETLSMMIDTGLLTRDDGHWVAGTDLATMSVPPSIHALLAARLDRLGPDERIVIQRASVIGRVFSLDAVHALMPDDDPPVAVDATISALAPTALAAPSKRSIAPSPRSLTTRPSCRAAIRRTAVANSATQRAARSSPSSCVRRV